jgi:hypothetical protein
MEDIIGRYLEKIIFYELRHFKRVSTLEALSHGFDMSLDLVFDVMHIAGLNLFKYYNINLFNETKLKNCTTNVKVICDVVEKQCPHEPKYE